MIRRSAEAAWIESRNRWQINVQREGVRKTFTSSIAGRKGKHEAEAKADKWLETFSSDQKLYDAIDAWYADKERSGIRQSTLGMYKSFAKQIKEHFSPLKRLSAITIYDWQKLLDKLADEGRKAGTIGQCKMVIGLICDYCRVRNWELTVPLEGQLRIPEAKEKTEKKALTPQQYKALLELSSDEYPLVDAFKLAVYTGLRRGELLGLQWSDISDTAIKINRIVTENGVQSQGKTDNALRVVPLSMQAKTLLNSLRSSNNDVWIFDFNGKNYAPYHIDRAWKKVAEAIGAKGMTIHELRHTFISIVQADLPEALLKQAVGHSASMDTYGIYGHQTAKDIAQSQSIIGSAFEQYGES